MNRLRSLNPPPSVVRGEHQRPGDFNHVRNERLAQGHASATVVRGGYTRKTAGAGCEYLHIAINDHTRISFAANKCPRPQFIGSRWTGVRMAGLNGAAILVEATPQPRWPVDTPVGAPGLLAWQQTRAGFWVPLRRYS